MYKIVVDSHFSAAHYLREYQGKCESLHGHNWKVKTTVTASKLNKSGMVVDFKELKEKLNKVLVLLDHKHLNEVTYFKKTNPTSENIAKFVYDKLSLKIKNKNIKLLSVSIWETESSSAVYSE